MIFNLIFCFDSFIFFVEFLFIFDGLNLGCLYDSN